MSEFFASLGLQARVVHAFILRETRTKFGRSKLGYFWALFEPLAYLLSMVGIFSALGRGAPIAVDIKLFFFTGIIPWLLFSRLVASVGGAIEANQQLLSYPQVKELDVVVARVILEFATLFLVSVLYLAVGYFSGFFTGVKSILGVLLGLFVVTLLGTGMGLVTSSIKLFLPSYGQFQNVLMRALFFTSGTFFVADSLPSEIKYWLWFNPVLHITEWVRSAFFYGFQSQFYNWFYPLICGLVFMFLGLASERVSRYKLRQV